MPLEEAILRSEFLAGRRLGPGSATAAEAPNMESTYVTADPASACTHNLVKSEVRMAEP